MKRALFLTLIAPALCAANCGTKIVTETKVVFVTCTAGEQNCGPPSAATSSTTAAIQPTSAASNSAHSVTLPPQHSEQPPAPLKTSPAQPPPVTVAQSSSVESSRSEIPSSTSGNLGGAPAATYNPLPEPAIFSSETPSNFKPLQGQPGKATIINSCAYDLYLNSVGCGTGVTAQLIAAGETYTEPIRDCTDAGVALHVTSKNHTKPVMVEYGASKQDQWFPTRKISYDLSFLDCMVKESTDLSGCAGWKEGHQCSGGKGSIVFACQPEEYCDRTSYTVPEYGQTPANKDSRIKIAAPVASAELLDGVVWEICAAGRK